MTYAALIGISFLPALLGLCPWDDLAPTHDQRPAVPRVLLHEDGVENAYPRLFANGRRLLYQSDRTGKWQLYLFDIATQSSRRLTSDTANNNFPDLSADNNWVAFVSDRDGNEEIYRMRLDGSGVERLTNDPGRDIHPYFSPDGTYLLFNSTRGNGSLDIYRLTLATGQVEQLTSTTQDETCARYAPDLRHIAFLRNDASGDDLYELDLRTGLTTNLTRTPATIDGWPMYDAEGRWIYYSTMASGAHRVHRMLRDGTRDTTLTFAGPGEEDGRAFVAADGQRLIFNRRVRGAIDILELRLRQ